MSKRWGASPATSLTRSPALPGPPGPRKSSPQTSPARAYKKNFPVALAIRPRRSCHKACLCLRRMSTLLAVGARSVTVQVPECQDMDLELVSGVDVGVSAGGGLEASAGVGRCVCGARVPQSAPERVACTRQREVQGFVFWGRINMNILSPILNLRDRPPKTPPPHIHIYIYIYTRN